MRLLFSVRRSDNHRFGLWWWVCLVAIEFVVCFFFDNILRVLWLVGGLRWSCMFMKRLECSMISFAFSVSYAQEIRAEKQFFGWFMWSCVLAAISRSKVARCY